jgi:hypothetical protein
MPKRTKLLTILAIYIVTMSLGAAIMTRDASSASTPIVAVSPFATGGVGFPEIGDTFSINITLAQATKILGYQFKLSYNTTILTAQIAETRAPFATASFDPGVIINETEGSVFMSYYTFLGDPDGLTTVDPVPIANIEFIVEANGTTTLDLHSESSLGHPPLTKLSDVDGNAIEPPVADGMFSNIEEIRKHDISITSFTISTSTAKAGDSVSITVGVKNNGDLNETFAVSTDYNGTLIRNETNISLEPGDSRTVDFAWNTANVNAGIYLVTARVSVAEDDFPGDNTRSGSITITAGGEGGGLLSNPFVFVGIAIVIIVIVAVAIYALRARKPSK